MNTLAGKITDAELAVMRVLWDAKEELPLSVIRIIVCKKTGLESTTVKTMVSRLHKKGVIKQKKRGIYYYSPLITEEEYVQSQAKNVVDKLFNGNAKKLVAALVSSRSLNEEDVFELREMFNAEYEK